MKTDDKSQYTIGLIYRHPDGNIETFNDIISNTLDHLLSIGWRFQY